MDPFDKQMERAQYHYDMHYDQPEDKDDADCEDDLTCLDSDEEDRENWLNGRR